MQALDVLLGHAALRAHLVDEAGDKPDHGVGHVAAFRLLEAALRVETLGDAAGNAVENGTQRGRLEVKLQLWDVDWITVPWGQKKAHI